MDTPLRTRSGWTLRRIGLFRAWHLVAFLAGALVLSGCGGGGSAGERQDDNVGHGVIGAEGGVIRDGSVEVRVEPGALQEPVQFSIDAADVTTGLGVPGFSRLTEHDIRIATSVALAPGTFTVRLTISEQLQQPGLLVAALSDEMQGCHFMKPRWNAASRRIDVPCWTVPTDAGLSTVQTQQDRTGEAQVLVSIGRAAEPLCFHDGDHVCVKHWQSQCPCSYAESIVTELDEAHNVYSARDLRLPDPVQVTVTPDVAEPQTNNFGCVRFPPQLPTSMPMDEACAHELVHAAQAVYNVKYWPPQDWFGEATAVAVAAEYVNDGQLRPSAYYGVGDTRVLNESFAANSENSVMDYYKYHWYGFLALRQFHGEEYGTLDLVRESLEQLQRTVPFPVPPSHLEIFHSMTDDPVGHFVDFASDFAVLGECPTYGPESAAPGQMEATVDSEQPEVQLDSVQCFSAHYYVCVCEGLSEVRFEAAGPEGDENRGWRIRLWNGGELLEDVSLADGQGIIEGDGLCGDRGDLDLVVAYVPHVVAEGSLRIRCVYPNRSPVIADLAVTSTEVAPTETTELTCSASDLDGDELSYGWSADGGTIERDDNDHSTAEWHAPDAAGTYTITVTVEDPDGLSDSETIQITVTSTEIIIE